MALKPHIEVSADGQLLSIYIIDEATGIPPANKSTITISLKDLPHLVGDPARHVQLRKLAVNVLDDAGNCNKMMAWFLMSELEPAA